MCGTFTGRVARAGLERLILGTMLSCPGALRARPLLKVNLRIVDRLARLREVASTDRPHKQRFVDDLLRVVADANAHIFACGAQLRRF
jgi:hypothetical protein